MTAIWQVSEEGTFEEGTFVFIVYNAIVDM